MRSQKFRSSVDECCTAHPTPPHRRHFGKWQGTPHQTEEELALIDAKAPNRNFDVDPWRANHIEPQTLQRWGKADPDAWPRSIGTPRPKGIVRRPRGEDLAIGSLQPTCQ